MILPHHARLLLDALGLGDRTDSQHYRLEDWAAAANLSIQAGVAPLFHHRLQSLFPSPDVPKEVSDQLRRLYLANLVRNVRRLAEYGRVLRALRKAGITVIALKGAHLGECVYKNIAVREMSDMDILLHEHDLDQVAAIIMQMGYHPRVPSELSLKVRAGPHWSFIRRDNLLTIVEAHWKLCATNLGVEVDYPSLWERSTEAVVAGVKVSVLRPADLLLHLCLHASLHAYNIGLRMICDIAQVLRVYESELDWQDSINRARQWKIGRCLFAGLWLAQEALRIPIQQGVLASLKPADFDESQQERLLSSALMPSESDFARGLPSENVARLWALQGWHRKIGLVWQRVFLPVQEMAGIYPVAPGSMKLFWHYPVRALDLLRRHGGLVWKLIRRDRLSIDRARRQTEMNKLKDWLLNC